MIRRHDSSNNRVARTLSVLSAGTRVVPRYLVVGAVVSLLAACASPTAPADDATARLRTAPTGTLQRARTAAPTLPSTVSTQGTYIGSSS